MTRETTNRDVQELYPESDAATKRELEGLANAISQFRSAVHHVAAQSSGSVTEWGLEQARVRQQSKQRRVVLEWAVAAGLCVVALLPAAGFYRQHAAAVKAQQQAQLLKQREADTALLDQVSNALSETVPDSMQPLADDSDNASYQTSGGSRNGRN